MTPFNIAFLFCRLLSIWCVARFVESFAPTVTPGFALSMLSRSQTPLISLIYYSAWSLGLMFLSCILWMGAPTIARAATRGIVNVNEPNSIEIARDWWNIGRGLLGLYLVATGISEVAAIATEYFFRSGAINTGFADFSTPLSSPIATLILGAALLLVARRAMKREAVQYNSTSSPNES